MSRSPGASVALEKASRTATPLRVGSCANVVPQKDNTKRNRWILVILAVFIVALFLVSSLGPLAQR